MAIFTKADLNSQKPENRIKALEKLDATTAQETFVKILIEDESIKVKEYALTKIDDPILLATNLNILSTNMQMASSARIVALLQLDILPIEVKKSALNAIISNPVSNDGIEKNIPNNVLVNYIFDDLIKEYNNEELGLYILELIQNLRISYDEKQAWLTKIALNSSVEVVKIKALELVTDEDNLQKIVDVSRKNKKIRKIAQKILQDIKQEELKMQELKSKCHKLALAARELSLTHYDNLLKNRCEHLQNSWLEINMHASMEDNVLFNSCMEDIRAKIATEEQILNAQREADEQLQKIKTCVQKSEELYTNAISNNEISTNYLKNTQQQIADLENCFAHLPNLDLNLTQKFNTNIAKLTAHIKAGFNYLENEYNLAKILESNEPNFAETAKQILSKINWQNEFKIPKPLQALQDKLVAVKKKLN